MTVTRVIRRTIREQYSARCGYCGQTEIDVGSELEIDHFQPESIGGSNKPENLVYCCTTCNRTKSDYWPPPDSPASYHLLHPLHDNVEIHIELLSDGRLQGTTARGWLHIKILHLNRPQLVVARLRRIQNQQRRALMIELTTQITKLQTQVNASEREIVALRHQIERLLTN